MKYYLMNAESGYPSANWKTAKGDTYLLDHALSFTQAQIESDTDLSNRAIWIPVRCDVAERLAKRMVRRHGHMRHMGIVIGEPSRAQTDAAAWLDEQDPGVKVRTHQLDQPVPVAPNRTISWITTSEPVTIGAFGGTTAESSLRAFQTRAVESIASAMAMGMLELTDAEWVVVRRALGRLAADAEREDPLYVGLQALGSPPRTFDYDPDEIQRCLHCKQLESQHVWTCDGCQGALRVGPDSQPLLHRCLPNGATLRCPAQ